MTLVLQGLIFLSLLLIVLGPVHWYLWRRLFKDTTRTRRGRRTGTITIYALVASLVGAFLVPRLVGEGTGFLVALVGYLWLAMLFYLLLILLVLEIPRTIAVRLSRPATVAHAATPGTVAATATAGPAGPAATSPGSSPGTSLDAATSATSASGGSEDAAVTRRLVIARGVAIGAGLVAAGVVGSGVRSALGPPQLKRIQIPLAKLPRHLDGYRIAVVSDIHLGPLTGVKHTRRIVDAINGMDADMVAVVGDLVDGTVAELADEAEPLRGLRSRDGSYFVTGNHEYYSGAQEWIEHVRALGMRPLQNERLEIRGLDLAGVNDAGGAPDYAKALKDRDPAKAVVLLAHQPVQAHEAAKYKVDLQLSGHTHGGQMAPFNYVVKLAQQPIVSGLGDVDGTKVYVTNGAGFWGPPVRVGAPPDITLVELRAS
jgi:predicted MPP superfamily phosphohydrolase